ncbi:MAG: heme exporter protein CcmD [Methylophilus sp.]|nr:heme exporter protein CcmD [Methylophilus sp.]
MQWHSIQAFIEMGGYGFYVWSSFGFTFFLMLLELWSLKKRHHAAKRLEAGVA